MIGGYSNDLTRRGLRTVLAWLWSKTLIGAMIIGGGARLDARGDFKPSKRVQRPSGLTLPDQV